VLVGLANHAGPDGSGAFPSVRTLMRYTGLSERTVRACLSRMGSADLIKRADRRPKGWDLDLTRIREDLAQEEVAVLERQFPGLAARLAAAARPGDAGAKYGGATFAPTGCNRCRHGVQWLHPNHS
jgi:hypothetical protein